MARAAPVVRSDQARRALRGRLWHAAAQHPVLGHGHLGVTGGCVQRHAVVQTYVLCAGRPRQRCRAAPLARTLDRCGHRGHLRCIRGACVRGLGQRRIDSRKRPPWHHHKDHQGQKKSAQNRHIVRNGGCTAPSPPLARSHRDDQRNETADRVYFDFHESSQRENRLRRSAIASPAASQLSCISSSRGSIRAWRKRRQRTQTK